MLLKKSTHVKLKAKAGNANALHEKLRSTSWESGLEMQSQSNWLFLLGAGAIF